MSVLEVSCSVVSAQTAHACTRIFFRFQLSVSVVARESFVKCRILEAANFNRGTLRIVTLPSPLSPEPLLVRLFDPEPFVRERAVDELPLGPVHHLYALRECLLADGDGSVRAAVPPRLVEANDQRVVPWLLHALRDPLPSVREVVWRALARLEVHEALDAAERAIAEEDVWWVRRAAIRTAAKLGAERALPLLLRALEDPFWRARYAAIQALGVLARTSPTARQLLEQHSATVATEPVRRALHWVLSDEVQLPAPVTESIDGVDEDPAVTTARLEQHSLPEATLVRLLGDPHEALRRLARRRLSKSSELHVARAVAAWLDEPRVPYAAETARALLDELLVDPLVVARSILADRGNAGLGQLAWACAKVFQLGEVSDFDGLRPLLGASERPLRVAAALALVRDDASTGALAAALIDPAVREAVFAWWQGQSSTSADARRLAPVLRAAASQTDGVLHVATARALALVDALRAALGNRDLDPRSRAEAIAGLAELGSLTATERATALADEDPWVRAAALNVDVAPELALTDPDPITRRKATMLLARERQHLDVALRTELAALLSTSLDPELRASACTLVLREDVDGSLGWLLRLSREAKLSVRSAAATALESAAATLEVSLEKFLAHQTDPDLRTTAYTWLLRSGDEQAFNLLLRALEAERAEPVLEHLRTVSLVFPDELLARHPHVVAQQPKAKAPIGPSKIPELPQHPSLRELGRTGVRVTPLILSGVNELAGNAFAEAVDQGATTFFWEPTHQSLSRFLRLRRAQPFTLIGGTYHSGAKSIRRDVENHLRALGRDCLDVMLLFWVRSAARVDAENFDALERLRAAGKIRTFGFSTHLRDVACTALQQRPWPVVMTRYSAAHPGAETQLLSLAQRTGVGVLAFTATCYGRMMQRVDGTDEHFALPSANECYRFVLTTPGLNAVLSAPRKYRELMENMQVFNAPPLPPQRLELLRQHGARVRAHSQRFNALIRQAANLPHPEV